MTKKKTPKYFGNKSDLPTTYYENMKKATSEDTIAKSPDKSITSQATDASLSDERIITRPPNAKSNKRINTRAVIEIIGIFIAVISLIAIVVSVIWFLIDLKYSMGNMDAKISSIQSGFNEFSNNASQRQNEINLTLEKILDKIEILFERLPKK
jgi:hypothetical protein